MSGDESFFLAVGVDSGFTAYIQNAFEVLFLKQGISQQQLADSLGLNKSYISRVVNGLQVPPIATRLKIAEKLGVDSATLWRVEHLNQIKQVIRKQKGEDLDLSKTNNPPFENFSKEAQGEEIEKKLNSGLGDLK